MVRVLAGAQRYANGGMSAEDIVAFLEGSFGAFQQMQQTHRWQWDRSQLTQALANLEHHQLIERTKLGNYILTDLGRLSGESGVEVETITRLVDVLRLVAPDAINEPTLITATQLAVELDQMWFPLNKKSTQKEPHFWVYQLRQQSVAEAVIQANQRVMGGPHQGTLRSKKAAACLMWMTDFPIASVEQAMVQFGGSADGAAGAIRSVTSRTRDVLSVTARVAEILHPALGLGERIRRLIARLEIGVPNDAADLAIISGNRLARSDYQRLLKSGLCSIESIEASSDNDLRACLEDSRNIEAKLAELRRAVRVYYELEREVELTSIIPPYA